LAQTVEHIHSAKPGADDDGIELRVRARVRFHRRISSPVGRFQPWFLRL